MADVSINKLFMKRDTLIRNNLSVSDMSSERESGRSGGTPFLVDVGREVNEVYWG